MKRGEREEKSEEERGQGEGGGWEGGGRVRGPSLKPKLVLSSPIQNQA